METMYCIFFPAIFITVNIQSIANCVLLCLCLVPLRVLLYVGDNLTPILIKFQHKVNLCYKICLGVSETCSQGLFIGVLFFNLNEGGGEAV